MQRSCGQLQLQLVSLSTAVDIPIARNASDLFTSAVHFSSAVHRVAVISYHHFSPYRFYHQLQPVNDTVAVYHLYRDNNHDAVTVHALCSFSASSPSVMSNDVVWQVLRHHNAHIVKRDGITLSGESGNLLNLHSYKFSGLANNNIVHVAAGKDKKIALTVNKSQQQHTTAAAAAATISLA
jgi:Ribosomal L28e protein family